MLETMTSSTLHAVLAKAVLANAVLSVALVLANVLGVAMIIPQVVHLHRHRRVDGVSAVWVGVGVGINVWWLVYAINVQLWGVLPVSVGGVALYLTIAAQYLHIAGAVSLRRFAAGSLGASLLPVGSLVFGDWRAVGVAIGVSYAVQFGPAVLEAFRSATVGGISLTTWLMALGEAMLWFGYGLVINDPALLIGGAGGAVMSAAIVWRLCRPNRRRVALAMWR